MKMVMELIRNLLEILRSENLIMTIFSSGLIKLSAVVSVIALLYILCLIHNLYKIYIKAIPH